MPDIVLKMGFGAFGKIPATGDFIRFSLPRGFIDPWDTWLQTGIAAARDTLGARWQDCFLSAPIWRFSIAPGLAGARAMLGVMMPSVDRVGRQFPLTLATPCADGHARAHLHARPLFERLEEIALAALDDLPLDMLKSRLADLPAPQPAGQSGGAMFHLADADDIAPAFATPPETAALFSARCGDDMRAIRCDALPAGAMFTAFFDLDAPEWQATS